MKTKNYKSNHVLEILSKLNRERKTCKDYCDITLTAGSRDFSTHRCILGIFSTFYHTMFTSKMREKYENKASIQGVDEETMEIVLNFIYTCDVTITTENVYDLLEAANYMDIPYLKQFCAEFLLDEMDSSNCLTLLRYAKLYNLDDLIKKANIHIAQNFEAMIQEKEFKELCFDDFLKIMQMKEKQVSTEECIFHTLIGWIKHDVTARDKHLTQLFNDLDLDNLSMDFLQNVVDKEELIMNSHECTKMLLQSSFSRCKTEQQEPPIAFLAFANNVALKFDVTKKEVTPLPRSVYNHSNGSVVSHNKKMYLISGSDNAVEVMDMTDENLKWKSLCEPTCDRNGSASAVYDDCIFTVGGNAMKTGERHKIADNSRDMIPDMNEGRWQPALAATGGFLFALGGFDFVKLKDTAECLELDGGRWKKLPPMKCARYKFPAVVLGYKLYAIGGYSTKDLDDVECYDLLKRKWHNVAKLKVSRSSHGACVINGKIYVAGGKTDIVEAYDPAKDNWEIVDTVPALKNIQFIAAI